MSSGVGGWGRPQAVLVAKPRRDAAAMPVRQRVEAVRPARTLPYPCTRARTHTHRIKAHVPQEHRVAGGRGYGPYPLPARARARTHAHIITHTSHKGREREGGRDGGQ